MRFVLICQTMMSSIRSVLANACACGPTLHSRCQPGGLGACRETCFPDREWWSQTGSNRRPHACKARALPTELWPRYRERSIESSRSNRCFIQEVLVGPGRLELPTSRLSGVRSNQLSYGPMAARRPFDQSHPWARDHIARPEACCASPIGDEWKEKRRRRNSAL